MSDQKDEDFYENRRLIAIRALYCVQGAIKLLYEKRLENDDNPLTFDEMDAILELRDKAEETFSALCPDFENWDVPEEVKDSDTPDETASKGLSKPQEIVGNRIAWRNG